MQNKLSNARSWATAACRNRLTEHVCRSEKLSDKEALPPSPNPSTHTDHISGGEESSEVEQATKKCAELAKLSCWPRDLPGHSVSQDSAARLHRPAFTHPEADPASLTNAVWSTCPVLATSTPALSTLGSKDYMNVGAWSSATLGNFH